MARDYVPGEEIKPSYINQITPDDGEIIVGGPDAPIRLPLTDFNNAALSADLTTFKAGHATVEDAAAAAVDANPTIADHETRISRVTPSTAGTARQYPTLNAAGAPAWHTGPVFDVSHPALGFALDGVTDDFTALQDLCDVVKALGGGVIEFPPGKTCYLDTATHGALTWDAHQNITLRGQGRDTSKITTSGPFLNAINASDGGTITNLTIHCTTATNTHHGILVDYPRDWGITWNSIRGFGGDSVYFKGGLQCSIEWNEFFARDGSATNGHAAIRIGRTDALIVPTTMTTHRNYVKAGLDYGYYIEYCADSLFSFDIAEYSDTGFYFNACSGQLIHPYTEAVTTVSVHLMDCPRLQIKNGRHYPGPTTLLVEWSGTASADRWTTQFGTGSYANDHVLGRDVSVGRDVTVGRGLAVGTTPAPTVGATVYGNVPTGDVPLVIQNDRYGDSTATASLIFRQYDTNNTHVGAGGKVVSARAGTYNESSYTHDTDLVLYAAANDADVEQARLLSAGGVKMPNAASAPATPASGGVFYVEAGALKYKGSSGTVTVLAPA